MSGASRIDGLELGSSHPPSGKRTNAHFMLKARTSIVNGAFDLGDVNAER
jgi:hypothetical protein